MLFVCGCRTYFLGIKLCVALYRLAACKVVGDREVPSQKSKYVGASPVWHAMDSKIFVRSAVSHLVVSLRSTNMY